jgi:RNA polymerase sigma-70 factor (ECF subfamily)
MDAVTSRWRLRSPDAESERPADRATALLRRVAAGDEAAFASLYDAVAPAVYGTVKRVVRNAAQADEVTQEVFVDLWRTAPRFDPAQGTALTWVLTLAHRRAVDRVRSEVSQQRRVERLQQVASAGGPSVADDVLDDLDRARVGRALADLTSLQRESVELAFYGGHTHAEISTILDLPLGTVKTRIRDGLIRLRDALGEGE